MAETTSEVSLIERSQSYAVTYNVAVSGPVVWQIDRDGLPTDAQPRPVATYVAPGRYGAK